MGALSLGLGWLVAGRFLRPLRTITTAAREISATTLHERLNLSGPDDELTELADTFDELLDRLERSFASERRFVANASHELRTPLAGMRASLDVAMAKPGPVPAHVVTLAERLRRELDRMDALLESFLALAKTQQGPLADQATLSLAELACVAIEDRAAAISAQGLNVEQRPDPHARVSGSAPLLARMVENVIENAIGHNQPDGWLRVCTAVEGTRARLVVENGGERLDPDDVKELSRPFRRAGAERTGSDRGAGLGLAIVASIAEVHGGTLDLAARERRRAAGRDRVAAGRRSHDMRVLVVEDSRTLADALVEGLQDEAMAVDVAYEGLEAAAKLDLHAYDVVVLDRDLPGIHGDTLCRMITERENSAMVLMLTASGQPAERVSGLSLGADDYLSKPFHFPELVLRVRALARRRPAAHARIFRAAGIELDPLHHTVTRAGRRLNLSAKEFALLEALMRAQHGVLSAEDLFGQVWDEHVDPFTNTVHVTLSRLRRKLGEPPAIETVPGVGYRVTETSPIQDEPPPLT